MSEYSPLWELTKSRLREFYREPGAVFWVFGFPILLAMGLGLAFRNKPPELPRVAVIETAAPWLSDTLNGSNALDVQILPEPEAHGALRTGAVDVVVRAVSDERVVYRLDPTRVEARNARLAVDDAIQRALGREDVLSSEQEAVTEAGSRYIDFLLPGILALNLMGSSMWGIGYSVVVNRKRRLLKRLAATPMRRSQYLLSYVFSRLFFLAAEVAALLVFARFIFDVRVQGSVLSLGALALLGAAAFAGLSLLIAARLESVEAASGWMNFVMLPMWLLSGSFFSYERFPEVIHPAIQMLPLTALNDALRAVVNDGAALAATWPQIAVLLIWGVVPFLIAVRVFRWQ